jgi:hypothetical protein
LWPKLVGDKHQLIILQTLLVNGRKVMQTSKQH